MTTRKERVSLLTELLSPSRVSDDELAGIAQEYGTFRTLNHDVRAAHLRAIDGSRARLIKEIHAEEGSHFDINKREFERTVGHNGAQPKVGYFLAYVLIARSVNPNYGAP